MRSHAPAVGTAILLAACAGGEPSANVVRSVVTIRDTAEVTVQAPMSVPSLKVVLDSPRVLWTPNALGRPNAMVVGPDGRVTVSDGRRLFAWEPGVDTTESVGRLGAGPGEYRSVSGLIAQSDGSLLVLDWRQRRLVRFDSHGLPDSTWSIPVDPTQEPFLALMGTQPVISTGRGMVHLGEPADTLFIRTADSSARTLGRLPLFVWARGPDQMLMPRDAYPPVAQLAGSAMAGFAFSDGLQYEVRWWRPGAFPEWLHLMRSWSPPPQSIDREPPGELLARLPDGGTMLRGIVNGGQRGERKPSLEELALMPGGALWVRPLDSSYVYAPAYYTQLAELRQAERLWEVFGRDGALRAQVWISSMFTPTTAHACQLYGLLEDADGAFSVAVIPLGEECVKLTRG